MHSSCCSLLCFFCFFFKQKTAYEMRISDWSSDVCSSDLLTLIPLRSTSEQSLKTFRALFINLLHMREITAAKLKQLFLDAFEHSLRSGSVDYIAACEEAFRDVRRMEQDYNSLVAAGPLVEALANGVKQRDVLRGKLHRLSPLLDSLLG